MSKLEEVGNIMTEREAQKKLFATFLYLSVPLVAFIVGGAWLGMRFEHPILGGLLGVVFGIAWAVAGLYLIFVFGHKGVK